MTQKPNNTLLADMLPGDRLSAATLTEILGRIFQCLLPLEGYTYRKAQEDLATHILEAIRRRGISLSEAEVGAGKTHAYLLAAALAKRGRLNDFWLRGIYPGQSYADSAYMPMVIATSSIALQTAIIKEYIPEISRILLRHGVITTPLTAVLRKGREHYLCQQRLQAYYMDAGDETRGVLLPLFSPNAPIDMAEVESITPYLRRRIGATGRCGEECPHRRRCRFQRHLAWVQSNRHDFQVCNHNYLLADLLRRRDEKPALIPHYQAVVIDEAHKFLQAARQMYGVELGSEVIPAITSSIRMINFHGSAWPGIWEKTRKLYGQHKRLFSLLQAPPSDDIDRVGVEMEKGAARHLSNIQAIAAQLLSMLDDAQPYSKHQVLCDQVKWELSVLRDRAADFHHPAGLICWSERSKADNRTVLGAIPKDLGESLHRDFWSRGIPVILTSGTLSAGGSFERMKTSLGLDHLPAGRVLEISKPSPFRYRDNVLLYISPSMPFPDNADKDYPAAVAVEVERLLRAAHGHAAVLFTSYRIMDMVWELLSRRGLPFPLFRLDRGGLGAIAGFRESNGGVLFASGAMWEGIDIPGAPLSLLIIVRLPFPVPDPISQYERSLYPSMAAYKRSVVVPDMLIKLRQGFGRLIRLETDTGVAAFLDCRMSRGGAYHQEVLSVLPRCPVVYSPEEVAAFLRQKKHADYFRLTTGSELYGG